jgi:putative tryptophan/tyrosine transport system substrate-binding protein
METNQAPLQPRRILNVEDAVRAGIVLALCGCSPAPSDPSLAPSGGPVIAFLSPVAQAEDVPFKLFAAAWANAASGRCVSASLQHVHAGNDQFEGLSKAAQRAAALHPAVMVAPTGDSARAARQSGQSPVVFASYLHPVRAGLVTSEGPRPENVTGVSLDDRLLAKRLEILREAFPAARRIGLLVDQAWRADSSMDEVLAAEPSLSGLSFAVFSAETAEQAKAILQSEEAAQVDAWYIPPTYVGYLAEDIILDHLRRTKTPAIHATTAEVRNGALMAYAQDTLFAYTAMASLANRVCNGEHAGSIPIERPRRFVLSLRANYDLGDRHIAPSVVARADKIE